jgi:hypothetical protein
MPRQESHEKTKQSLSPGKLNPPAHAAPGKSRKNKAKFEPGQTKNTQTRCPRKHSAFRVKQNKNTRRMPRQESHEKTKQSLSLAN